MSAKGKSKKFPGVTAKPDGSYHLRYYATHPTEKDRHGKPRQYSKEATVHAPDVREALQMKLDLERQLRETFQPAAPEQVSELTAQQLFGALADDWLEAKREQRFEADPTQAHLKPATSKKYGNAARFLKRYFGDLKAVEITAEDIRRWRHAMIDTSLGVVEKGYKRSYINTQVAILKMVLNRAGNTAADELQALNTKPDAQITRMQPNQLTADEFDRFLNAIRRKAVDHHAFVLILFTTTLRISTALALRREDFMPDTGEILVTRSLSDGALCPGTKTDRFSEETPPLLPEVWAAVQAHWETFNEKQAESGLAFPAKDGRHQSRSCLRKAFAKALKAADIEKRFTPHGCRRTGTKLYGRTSGTRVAMAIAGHKTEAMSRHYQGQLEPAEKLQAARGAFPSLRVIEGHGEGTSAAPAVSKPAADGSQAHSSGVERSE